MLNIIKSELYKMIHRRCTYVFLIVFVAGGFFLNPAIGLVFKQIGKKEVGDLVIGFWLQIVASFSWFLVYMIAQIIHSNESKTGVLKNTISFGISRTKLYVARFLTQLIALVVAIVLVSGTLLLGNLVFNGGCSHDTLMVFLRTIASTTILWIAALSFAHALAMCLSSNSIGTVIYILYFLIANAIIEMMHMAMPNNAIVTFLFKYELYEFGSRTIVANEVAKNLANYFWVGGVYLLVTFGLGVFFFRRKEVK